MLSLRKSGLYPELEEMPINAHSNIGIHRKHLDNGAEAPHREVQ